jgi:hypothetical protein
MPVTFAVAVDLVVLTVADGQLHALVIERGVPPHEGEYTKSLIWNWSD